jgi:hypothetical protein
LIQRLHLPGIRVDRGELAGPRIDHGKGPGVQLSQDALLDLRLDGIFGDPGEPKPPAPLPVTHRVS